MSLNEYLAMPVFEEIVEHKPDLASLLESVRRGERDNRYITDEVIKSFPFPIGVELRRLFSQDCEKADWNRLQQMLKMIERVTQFVGFILLSQLLEEYYNRLVNTPLFFTEVFRKDFASFKTPSFGFYASLIRQIGAIFQANSIEPFIKEMGPAFFKEFLRKIDPLINNRNEIKGHDRYSLDGTLPEKCLESQEALTAILKDVAFLAKTPMVAISEINVRKRKRHPVRYDHHVKMLNDMLSNTAHELKDFTDCSDSSSVLLVKDKDNPTYQYLNLSPFVIDTHAEVFNTPEKIRSIRKDIFLYYKWAHEKIYYASTEAAEPVDLKNLSNYAVLVAEMKEYFTIFGGEAA